MWSDEIRLKFSCWSLTQSVPAISLVHVTSCGPQTFPMSTCTIPATGSGNLIVIGWQSGAGVDTPVTIGSVTDNAGNIYAEAGAALSADSASGSVQPVHVTICTLHFNSIRRRSPVLF
jgi:hypothetical protein